MITTEFFLKIAESLPLKAALLLPLHVEIACAYSIWGWLWLIPISFLLRVASLEIRKKKKKKFRRSI